MSVLRADLHDEEGVENLHGIKECLDNLYLLLGIPPNILPWAK